MKILILSGSYGAGHITASQSLKNYSEAQGDSVEVLDMAIFFPRLVGKWTKYYYEDFCQSHTSAWKYTDKFLGNSKVLKLIQQLSRTALQKKFNKQIEKLQPDIILITFPYWSIFLGDYFQKGFPHISTGIILTDAITIHPLWHIGIENSFDYIFTIDQYSQEILEKRLEKFPGKIKTTFFPLEERCFIEKKTIDNKRIVIILSGLKKKFTEKFLREIKNTEHHITILRSRNKRLYERLVWEFWWVKNFEFIEFLPIKEHLQEIDMIIWKPGWAIMSECIASNTPLLIPAYLPGQEEGNLKLLEKIHMGIHETSPEKMVEIIQNNQWGGNTHQKKDIANKYACRDIYETLIEYAN